MHLLSTDSPTPSLTRLRASPLSSSESVDDKILFEELDLEAEGARSRLQDWDLDAWSLPDAEVKRLMLHFFHSCGLLRRFSIRPINAVAFIDAVAERYRPNPFHSYRHAFTVAHTAWRFISPGGQLRKHLEDLDVLVR